MTVTVWISFHFLYFLRTYIAYAGHGPLEMTRVPRAVKYTIARYKFPRQSQSPTYNGPHACPTRGPCPTNRKNETWPKVPCAISNFTIRNAEIHNRIYCKSAVEVSIFRLRLIKDSIIQPGLTFWTLPGMSMHGARFKIVWRCGPTFAALGCRMHRYVFRFPAFKRRFFALHVNCASVHTCIDFIMQQGVLLMSHCYLPLGFADGEEILPRRLQTSPSARPQTESTQRLPLAGIDARGSRFGTWKLRCCVSLKLALVLCASDEKER